MGIQEEEEPQENPGRSESFNASQRTVAAAADASKKRGRLVSLPGPNRTPSQLRVSVMQPKTYDEVEQIADHLKDRQPVIVSLDGLDKAVSRRIIDFVSGTTYALDGSIHRIGDNIFMFAPINVSIDAELARSWQEGEIFS